MAKMGLKASKQQVDTLCGLRNILELRHSIICLGGPRSGKSTAI